MKNSTPIARNAIALAEFHANEEPAPEIGIFGGPISTLPRLPTKGTHQKKYHRSNLTKHAQVVDLPNLRLRLSDHRLQRMPEPRLYESESGWRTHDPEYLEFILVDGPGMIILLRISVSPISNWLLQRPHPAWEQYHLQLSRLYPSRLESYRDSAMRRYHS